MSPEPAQVFQISGPDRREIDYARQVLWIRGAISRTIEEQEIVMGAKPKLAGFLFERDTGCATILLQSGDRTVAMGGWDLSKTVRADYINNQKAPFYRIFWGAGGEAREYHFCDDFQLTGGTIVFTFSDRHQTYPRENAFIKAGSLDDLLKNLGSNEGIIYFGGRKALVVEALYQGLRKQSGQI